MQLKNPSYLDKKIEHVDKIVEALDFHLQTRLSPQEKQLILAIFPDHMRDLLPTEYDARFLYLVQKMRQGIRS